MGLGSRSGKHGMRIARAEAGGGVLHSRNNFPTPKTNRRIRMQIQIRCAYLSANADKSCFPIAGCNAGVKRGRAGLQSNK